MKATIIKADNISIRIKDKQIISNFSINIDRGKIYSIIGPNGSGKTTLLRSLSRNLKPSNGCVWLNGKNLSKIPSRKVAQSMAVLTQSHFGMSDVTVRQLISYGRFAYRNWWKGKQALDNEIVNECIKKTGLSALAHRKLSTLSGGERQRAWIAMALAQKPQILILDEPTTFLDIAHQLEVLELVSQLNKDESITILMVLHDINHAARYSDELIVIKNGELVSAGKPWDVLTSETLKKVFNVEAVVTKVQEVNKPIFYAKNVIKG